MTRIRHRNIVGDKVNLLYPILLDVTRMLLYKIAKPSLNHQRYYDNVKLLGNNYPVICSVHKNQLITKKYHNNKTK